MSSGEGRVTGDERRQVLIRQGNTFYRARGRGTIAPAFACLRFALAAAILAVVTLAASDADAANRELKLYNTHTKERATIIFKRNGRYDRAGLAKINKFMRDWRRNEPTKMDPKLLDLIWDAYRQTGSNKYIHVISGYRSPATNNALRKRSKGVAKQSQHMRGKAMDFYIPGVPLAKLRAIGLRSQVGGVGYYPRSGSPFVHMDTGNVRHWPRMSRKQLVQVFPNGRTLHVPSDGKPLKGYSRALASHKMRGRSKNVASFDNNARTSRKSRKSVGEPVVIASVSGDIDDRNSTAPEPRSNPFAEATAIVPPLPRPSPIPAFAKQAPVILATAEPMQGSFQPWASPPVIASTANATANQPFGSAGHWSSPPVPMELARAMAERDISRPTSLPIYPTAVVATINVSRPLRAEAITSAVISQDGGTIRDVTPVFAYAESIEVIAPAPTRKVTVSPFGVPVPIANPLRVATAPNTPAVTGSIGSRPRARFATEELTLTVLDTLGLRQWIGDQSTRQKQYAVLTMPDFSRIPSLFEKPQIAYSAGFGDSALYRLRTDRFSGPMTRHPAVTDLSSSARLALR